MNDTYLDLSGSTILVVDDTPGNLDLLCRALEEADYEVQVARDGQMALSVVERFRPDLILLDVVMPGLDGFATCRRLKEQQATREIPVIFLTARNETTSVVEGFRAGGVDYITKPFQKEEVLVRIQIHLERSRLAGALARLNAELEQEVEERTRQLQLRLKELEGKDRIAEHLLTYHTLEETLELVLEVIAGVMGVERAAIYLKEKDGPRLAAAIGLEAPGKLASRERLAQESPEAELQRAFAQVEQSGAPVNVRVPIESGRPPYAVVPIARGGELLGFMEVGETQGLMAEDELKTLGSFALQAAVAINDALVQQDAGKWNDQLDRVLEMKEGISLDDLSDQLEK